MIQSINPATGELLRSFDPLGAEALAAKLALAWSMRHRFADETIEQRGFWMRRLAALLESERDEIAAVMTQEMGKTIVAARQEVLKCASVCRYYAEHSEAILEPEPIPTEHAASFVRWDPLGVILAVMPWNFPFWQVFRFCAPALMAGNICLLKHAENVPLCALLIESLVRRAGFPRGAFQSLLLEVWQVEHVLADERVAAVTVTGSEAAGRAVAAQAGWLLKKSVLELGGSDPFIVMPSADLPEAIRTAVKARAVNNGQSCIAAKRFLVHDEVYERFVHGFVRGMERLRVGDPSREETEVGPLATPGMVENMLAQVEWALLAGGRVLTGGHRMEGDGLYFEPTVIEDVPWNAEVAKEETFGPLAMVFRVRDLDDAIRLANGTNFGLGASCWTHDPEEQEAFARDIEAGCVFFNAPVASDPRLPFGGVKHSGYGRELSAAGMLEFMNAKTVVLSTAEPPRVR